MNQKGFSNIALVVVVVAIIAVGGYFVLSREQKPVAQQTTRPPATTQNPTSQQPSPTPISETASWKTYTDNDFGFSFEYPSKYLVSREGRKEYAEVVLTITSDSKKLGIMDSCRGEYTVQVKKSDISFDQLEREAKSKYNYISDLSIESKTIDGHKALRVSGINKVGTDFTGKHTKDYPEDFILFDNGNTYIGLYPCSDEYYNRDEISQIFSSFRFIK